jgi:hypothetical protein
VAYDFNNCDGGASLYADIRAEDGRLLVYWRPFNDEKSDSLKAKRKNQFFKNNIFSIALEERTNLSFPYRSLHAGVLTVPIKTWLSRRDDDKGNNIQTSTNAGLYIGYKWGRSKFVKLPNEKEYGKYVTGYSVNLFGGISKLDINEKNSMKEEGGISNFNGSVAAINTGLAFAYHYKNFAFFIPVGWDIPLSGEAQKWVFKGKPWIGFGTGFDIF